jgi:uncharacterized protein YegL
MNARPQPGAEPRDGATRPQRQHREDDMDNYAQGQTDLSDEEIPDIETQIADNTEQRTPCVLVLDCSSSMQDQGRIDALNEGLKTFAAALQDDDVAMQRVMLKIITFGGHSQVTQVTNWLDAPYFDPPTLEANGNTPMGAAMDAARAELESIKQSLQDAGVSYTRPWIFLMTDGMPTEHNWAQAAARSALAVAAKKAMVWPIAVPGAEAGPLQAFAGPDMQVYQVDGTDFGSLFLWLSTSLSQAASTAPGDELQIEAPSMVTLSN